MDKAHEFKVDLQLMFIDFQRAFDSIKRVYGLVEMNVDSRLIQLCVFVKDFVVYTNFVVFFYYHVGYFISFSIVTKNKKI